MSYYDLVVLVLIGSAFVALVALAMRYATKMTENGWRLRLQQRDQQIDAFAIRFDGLSVVQLQTSPAPVFVAVRGSKETVLPAVTSLGEAIERADLLFPPPKISR